MLMITHIIVSIVIIIIIGTIIVTIVVIIIVIIITTIVIIFIVAIIVTIVVIIIVIIVVVIVTIIVISSLLLLAPQRPLLLTDRSVTPSSLLRVPWLLPVRPRCCCCYCWFRPVVAAVVVGARGGWLWGLFLVGGALGLSFESLGVLTTGSSPGLLGPLGAGGTLPCPPGAGENWRGSPTFCRPLGRQGVGAFAGPRKVRGCWWRAPPRHRTVGHSALKD